MQRRAQVIQLSDHVKNRIQQTHLPSLNSEPDDQWALDLTSVFSSSDDDESLPPVIHQNMTRPRRSTFTVYQLKPPLLSPAFFTATQPTEKKNFSFLQQHYQEQNPRSQQSQPCLECSRRDRLLHLEHQRLSRLYEDNRKLADQLRSFMSLNHLYREENHKLQYDLSTINAHLQEYQTNFDQLKQKIEPEEKKIITPKIEETKQKPKEATFDRLKQLRREVHVYNQILAEKRQQEESAHKDLMKFLS